MQNGKDTMMFITQMENDKKSFGLIAISQESPFLEIRFSLEHKILTVMTKVPTREYKIIPKLDSNGNPKPSKFNKEGICFERVEVDAFYSYTLTNKKDIINLITFLDTSVDENSLEEFFAIKFAVEEMPIQSPIGKVEPPAGVNLKVEK